MIPKSSNIHNNTENFVNTLHRIARRFGITRNPTARHAYRGMIKVAVRLRLGLSKVPIIAISGTNGKTTTTRLVERILRDAGYQVGAGTTEGVTHNGRLIWRGDGGGILGTFKASQCPDVDVLVLETARGGIIKHGIGFHRCQVGLVTNVYEDHMGLDGIHTIEQMASLKASIARRVHTDGTLVLNADNPHTRHMAGQSRGRAIYFTNTGDDLRYDRLFFMRGNCIFKRLDRVESLVADARELPLTYGNVVTYNTENIMAALACIEGVNRCLPIARGSVNRSLMSFGIDPQDNFNRFTLFSYGQDQAILTRSKNAESCSRDMQIVQRLRHEGNFHHVVGIMTGMGDRKASFHRQMAAIASSACNYFLIRPPKREYLRGRTGDEIVRILSANIPKDRIISNRQCRLIEAIELSRKKLSGRILFVVLNIYAEAKINFRDVLEEADSVNPLAFQSQQMLC